ncbi:MAG TPA: SRPBCC domain-containing protein [Opitutales bacterium]|jgi:uncharacterized protein YndB with AHSA1/START domain|nr:SRPBCC domain-containing protein [Opitutales bacterium]
MSTKKISESVSSDREIVISRVFDAPRELVWEAWTNPKHVVNWWGPVGFTTTIEKMDVRPGGVWKHVMHGPDGTDNPNKSNFVEVMKPERIVYNHGGGKKGGPGVQFQSTWTFEELEGKTRLTIRMVFATAEKRNVVVKEYGAIEGGKQTLGRLAEYLAKAPVVVERIFNAPPKTVWRALTELEQMRYWFFPDIAAFRAKVGFEFSFNAQKDGKNFLHLLKITQVVPGKKLTYQWKYHDHAGDSYVTYELFAKGKKTLLRLTHTGLETFAPERNPDFARGNFFQGWSHIIGVSLQGYLERPRAEVSFTRIFDAPRELVWKAWTDPKQMAKWWGPKMFTNPICKMDVRPGGKLRIVMRAPNGFEHPMTGVFREVTPPSRLVLTTLAVDENEKPLLEGLADATFIAQGKKTKLILKSHATGIAPIAAQMLGGMKAGWSQSLVRLRSLLAKD